MAKILNKLDVNRMNEKERSKYMNSLRYSLNIDPKIQERGFFDLAGFYLNKENFLMAGYCFELAKKFDEACELYFGTAYNMLLEERIGEKNLSKAKELVDIALSHPKLLDKCRVAYVIRFLDKKRNQEDNVTGGIVHKLEIVYKAKSKRKSKNK